MNAKHRKAKLERARAHQKFCRQRDRSQGQLTLLREGSAGEQIYKQTYGATAPKDPRKARKRVKSPRWLRTRGRKVGQRSVSWWERLQRGQ